MTRDEAYSLLTEYLTMPNLIKHSLATEAAMRALCIRLNPSADAALQETWGIAGLLHDADYELTKGEPHQHGLLITEKEAQRIPEDISYAIKAHNYENTKVLPKSPMDWALACSDQLTGLIVASALVHPDKKLASITPEFVLNRMGSKSFAKGANRVPIRLCEEKLGIPLSEFIAIVLSSMQSISTQLEL